MMTPSRPRVPCPGCTKIVTLAGPTEVIPVHNLPGPVSVPKGGSKAMPRCRWSGDLVPGRPDGRLSPVAARAAWAQAELAVAS